MRLQGVERFGKGRAQRDVFIARGMLEIQLNSVQREPTNGIGDTAIRSIPDDRMATFGEMHADLVFTTRFQLDCHKRGLWRSLQNFHVRHSTLSKFLVRRRVDAVRRIFRQVGSDGEGIVLAASFDHGHVSPARAVVFELALKPLFGFYGFRENNQARGISIQPVNDEELLWTLLTIQVRPQNGISRFRLFRRSGDREQARGLIDHDDAVVFVDNL